METNIEAKISLHSILIKIGFLPSEIGLKLDLENCKLEAFQGYNRYFQEGYSFFGYYFSGRSAGEFDFFLPLQLESYEQGIALLAYYLRNTDLEIKPDWLNEGLLLKEYLPWEKVAKAYNENPKATIEHEWFRVLAAKIKLLAFTAPDEDLTTLSFDGTLLKVVCNNEIYVISGLGTDWQRTAKVKTQSLNLLPQRIPKRNVEVFIWEDKLHIGNRIFDLET